MRLTLRTLLAYLDDTLEPAAARELGQKLAETPTAQELVSRIKEVTRRRRLTAPPVAGDEIEPDELAEYLDSMLAPDAITRVERVCLDSDVHLAEVAACHQILTMIGQPARVTDATRRRMYDLVHAIESIPADRRIAARRAERMAETPASAAMFAGRPVLARLLSVAAVVILSIGIGVFGWISFNWSGGNTQDAKPVSVANADNGAGPDDIFRPKDLKSGQTPTPPPLDSVVAEPEKRTNAEPAGAEKMPADSAVAEDAAAKPESTKNESTKPAPAKNEIEPAANAAEVPAKPADPTAKPPADPNAKPAEPATPPPAPIASYTSTSGVLMHQGPGNKDWRRLVARSPIAPAEQLLCLPYQRAALQLETGATAELVGETELAAVEPMEQGIVAHLKLDRGRVVLGANQPNAAFRVDFRDQSWVIHLKAAENEVGFQVTSVWRPGGPSVYEAALFVPRGEVEYQTAAAAGTLGGPVLMRWSSAGGLREKESLSIPPAWMEKEEMTQFQIRAASAIDQLVPKEASPVLPLIEATGSDRREQRSIAIRSLGAIGRLAPLIDAMSTLDKRDVRQEAIATLRQYLARGPEQADALLDALLAKLNKDRDRADGVMKLLRGLTDSNAKEKDAYDALIKLLRSPELGIRELAIMNLEELAGKLQNVVYQPDKPSDAAINAWRKELDNGRLPPRERGKM